METYQRAIIFANGRLDQPEFISGHLREGDLLIAADGGSRHMQRLDLQPHVLIGDFDSLSPQEIDTLQAAGVQILRHPAHKDYTDLELALLYAARQGAREALVFGALGGRWDQSLANLLLPAAPDLEHIEIHLVEGLQQISLLRGGHTRRLQGQPGETISLIPIGGAACGIHTQGLEYPLDGEDLHFGTTRGISNTLLSSQASVSLQSGLLLVVQSPETV